MIIEHIAMYVSSLDCAKDFFIKYFNAKCGKLYYNEKTGFRSYFLTFGFGARLEIMNKPGISVSDNLNKTGYAHIAFKLENLEVPQAEMKSIVNEVSTLVDISTISVYFAIVSYVFRL